MSFSVDEILEMAVQIERNGVTFYRRVAEVATSPTCKKLLLSLADMEDEHRVLMQSMKASLPANSDLADEFGDADEALHFIREVADGHIFDVQIDPTAILTGSESEEEILSTAIGLEKESIVYYSALAELLGDAPDAEKVRAVIREEMSHIAELSGQRESLKQ